MFVINSNDVRKLEDDLKTFASKSIPFATRKTLNDSAFAARAIAQADVRQSMVNRNKFTAQSIQVDMVKTLQVSRQEAIVGSIAGYMEDQEFGATKRKSGKEGVQIATSYSAGQGEGGRPRTRLPRKANSMAAIQLSKRRKKGGSRKQQNLVAIKQAAATGRKFVFLDLGKSKGIFKVTGGKRRPKIKMVHDMSRESVVVPKDPWLAPAFNEALRMQPAFYADALRFQARKHNLFT